MKIIPNIEIQNRKCMCVDWSTEEGVSVCSIWRKIILLSTEFLSRNFIQFWLTMMLKLLLRVYLDFHEKKYLTFMSMDRVEICVLYKLSDKTQILLWFTFTTWP